MADLKSYLKLNDEQAKAVIDELIMSHDERLKAFGMLFNTRFNGQPLYVPPPTMPYPFVGETQRQTPIKMNGRIIGYAKQMAIEDFYTHPLDAPAGWEFRARLGYSRLVLCQFWGWLKSLLKKNEVE